MQDTQRPGWNLVWSDEFDGTAIDRSKWDFDLGNGFYDYKNHAWVPGWGNEELQYYTHEPENVQVRDSCLFIRAVKAPLHGCGYTSARLKTKARDGTVLFSKQYGRVEFRAKVPWGKGLWPALWMLPVEDKYGGWAASGEIDLMEIVGEKPHEVLNSIHFGSTYPKRSLITTVHALPEGSMVSDWHTYAVEWEPGEIRFYVDGVQTCTYDHWWSCSKLEDGQGVEPKKAGRPEPLAGALRPALLPGDERRRRRQLPRRTQRGHAFPGRTGGRLRARLRQDRRLRRNPTHWQGPVPLAGQEESLRKHTMSRLPSAPSDALHTGVTRNTEQGESLHEQGRAHSGAALQASAVDRSTWSPQRPRGLDHRGAQRAGNRLPRHAATGCARPVLQPLPGRPAAGLAGQ
jgi:hypothetical protein